MEHVKAIVIKFVMITAVLGIVLTGFFDIGFTETLIISFILTLAAYVLGDIMIFRMAGGKTEHGKKKCSYHIFRYWLCLFCHLAFRGDDRCRTRRTCIGTIVSALIIGTGEWFYHGYLDKRIFHNNE